MAKLWKTPQGVFYQEDNGRQIPISDPAMLRDLYSGRSGNQFDVKEMTASQAPNSINARSFPDLTGASATAGINAPATPQDKYAIFNDSVQNLIQQFQNAPTSEEAYKALYKTQQQAASQGFMPLDPSLIGAAPSDIKATRNAGISMYEPEENAIKAKIKSDEERSNRFIELVKVAKDFGESFQKSLPMDDATAQSITTLLSAGKEFNEDVITKWANSNLVKNNPSIMTNALQSYASSKSKGAGSSGLTLNQLMDNSLQLRKEVTNSIQYKEWAEIRSQVGRMKATWDAYKAGDLTGKNAASQAVLVVFQKALDPNSVVRESEYARSPEGQALINKIPGYISKLSQGGVGMTDSELKDFITAATKLENASNKIYTDFYNQSVGLAAGYGLDPKQVYGTQYEPKAPLKPSSNVFRLKDPKTGVIKEFYDLSTKDLNEAINKGFKRI